MPGREGAIAKSRAKTELTPRERRYIRYRFGTSQMSQADAYIEAVRRPRGTESLPRESAGSLGSAMEKRIRAKGLAWMQVLEAAEIDDLSLAGDLNWARTAMRTEFYQGNAVATVTDNGTRMRAIELTAEILGHRKAAVELSGAVGLKGYTVVSPDDWDTAPAPGAGKSGPISPPAPAEPDPEEDAGA